MRQSDEEANNDQTESLVHPTPRGAAAAEQSRGELGSCVPGTLIGLWVFSYWVYLVFVNPRALGSRPGKDGAPNMNFTTCMHKFGILLLLTVNAVCMIFLCLSCRSGAPREKRCPSPFAGPRCRALCNSRAVRNMDWAATTLRYSWVGIFACDRWLKIQDVASDCVVIFGCPSAEWWTLCPKEALWWGRDWWWAHLALFFALNSLVVVWVVTAPIFVRQLDKVLRYSWISYLVWLIAGLPTVVILDVVMLFRFPGSNPRSGWLTEVLLLQKVAEAMLEAPFQASLQLWIFVEKRLWEDGDDDDGSSIPWMLIFSCGTSALTFCLTAADIQSQAVKLDLSFTECLCDLLFVGLRKRAPLLHALPKQSEVSYEDEGQLSPADCRDIATVALQCKRLERLIFVAGNRLLVEAMCALLFAVPPCLQICGEHMDLTYKRDNEGKGSLCLDLRDAELSPKLVDEVVQLIRKLERLQSFKIGNRVTPEILTSEGSVEACEIEKFADFIRVCLTLKLALPGCDPIKIDRQMTKDLRLRLPIAAANGGAPGWIEYNGSGENGEPQLCIPFPNGAELLGWPFLRELLDRERLPKCSLVLLADSSPLTLEECRRLEALDLRQGRGRGGLPSQHPTELETPRLIHECSTLEVMFNDSAQHIVKLTVEALKTLKYNIPDKDEASYDPAYGDLTIVDMLAYRTENLPTYIQLMRSLRMVHFGDHTARTAEECRCIADFVLSRRYDYDAMPRFSLGGTLTINPVAAGEHNDLWQFIHAWFVLYDIFRYEREEMHNDELQAILGARKLALPDRGEYSWEACQLRIEDHCERTARTGHDGRIGPDGCFHAARLRGEGLRVVEIGAGHSIGPEGCGWLKALRDHLVTLAIGGGNGIGVKGCEHLKELHMLQRLVIGGGNEIGAEGCWHLQQLRNLGYLDLGEENRIGPEGWKHLQHLAALRTLKIGARNDLNPEGWKPLKLLAALQTREIGARNDLDPQGWGHLRHAVVEASNAAGRRQLVDLELGDDNGIGAWGGLAISLFQDLKTLRIGDRSGVEVKTCESLARLKNLTELSIGGENAVHHEGCWHLKGLKTLERLKIGNGNKITQAGCKYLSEIQSLQYVEIGENNDVKDAGCRSLTGLPNLLQINVMPEGNAIGPEGTKLLENVQKRRHSSDLSSWDMSLTRSMATGSTFSTYRGTRPRSASSRSGRRRKG